MRRTIRSGAVIEKSQYFVGARKPRSDRKRGSSSQQKLDRNLNQSIRNLARTLNCNCSPLWLFVTLTYEREPQSGDEAAKQCRLFLRRLSRVCGSLKVIWITADKDKKGNPARLHHHLILHSQDVTLSKIEGKETAEVRGRKLSAIWGQGIISAEPLEEQRDYTPLAAYLIRQAVAGPDTKKWHLSRGLEKPVIIAETIITTASELRAPGGAEVLEIGKYDAETGCHYIRYIRPEKKKKEFARIYDPEPAPDFVNQYGLKGYALPLRVYKTVKKTIEACAFADVPPLLISALIVIPGPRAAAFETKLRAGELFTSAGAHRKWLPAYMYQVAILLKIK